ncbi:HAAS signaling domain-containing protein [Luteipulveratus mongoliensis]|uniref:HAAS signaling domain-containing protein n=1 Tax=Luteipulveratus mongoliensis TaxID=571913 RepID=UPI000697863E|nr:hypothetical protein [Luteipulveratus mongoliensis]
MSTATDVAVSYQERVRAALADLPPAELEEVLEDVAGHLDEVTRELGDGSTAALEARLGSPEEYAAELRAAADYPPPARSRQSSHGAQALMWGGISVGSLVIGMSWMLTLLVVDVVSVFWMGSAVVSAFLGIAALRRGDPRIVTTTAAWKWGVEVVRRFEAVMPDWLIREVRDVGQPVWWCVRGALGGLAAYRVLSGNIWWEYGSVRLVAPILFGAVLSVWVARTSQRDRRWLWFVVPFNVAVALTCFATVFLPNLGVSAWTGLV